MEEERKEIILNGQKVGLYYCLGTAKDISALCDGLEKIGDYLTSGSDGADVIDRIANVIFVLNHWYCKASACNGVKIEPVTRDFLDLYLDPNDAETYMNAINEAISNGTKQTVKIKTIPTKNAKSGRRQSS